MKLQWKTVPRYSSVMLKSLIDKIIMLLHGFSQQTSSNSLPATTQRMQETLFIFSYLGNLLTPIKIAPSHILSALNLSFGHATSWTPGEHSWTIPHTNALNIFFLARPSTLLELSLMDILRWYSSIKITYETHFLSSLGYIPLKPVNTHLGRLGRL